MGLGDGKHGIVLPTLDPHGPHGLMTTTWIGGSSKSEAPGEDVAAWSELLKAVAWRTQMEDQWVESSQQSKQSH